MKKLNNKMCAFMHSLGVVTYIFLVATFMRNAERIFGKEDTVIAVMTVLTLFVLSATIVGGLIFCKPVMMYLDGDKKDALKMLLHTIAWLFIMFVVFLVIIVLV